MNARREALADAVKDLELDTVARARSIEADLAGCRADLLFLAGTPPVAGIPAALRRHDPFRVRWSRLDAQGSLLLFLGSHPEVSQVVIRDGTGVPLLVAGRQEGAPQMFAPSTAQGGTRAPDPPPAGPVLSGRWALAGGEGSLEAVVGVGALVGGELPTPARFMVRGADGRDLFGAAEEGSGSISVEAPVQDDGWDPPVLWTLVRRVDEEELVASVSRLATGVRMNLMFNLAVITLALVLGVVGLRQAQRTARLEEQARQQTQVRELERQLFHSERLSSVGRLAAGLAHEVNNPLEGMTNYLKLLEDDLSQGRIEEARQALPSLREGLNRAAGIVRQVLQFSTPASAPMGPIDLAAVLRESIDFVRNNREFRGVDFVTELPGGLPPVSGNRLLLGQLFLNLILNACQAQPGGGTVEVTAGGEPNGVLARVADRGLGVPEEDRERIFEPFFSSRHSTGLGLSVCRRIAEQHGSELRLASRPGGGAEFSLLLRRAS